MKIFADGVERDATPEEEAENSAAKAALLATQVQSQLNNSGAALELRRTEERKQRIAQLIAEGNLTGALGLLAETL